MTKDISNDNKDQEAKKKEVVENFNDKNLEWYLEALSKEELKNICRNLKIKGFSSKNKEDLVDLITTSYFENDDLLQSMMRNYDSGFKVLLDTITEQDENYIVFHHDIPDNVFLYYADDTELLFIPQDVKEHFKSYKAAHPEFKADIDKINFYHSALNLYGFVSLQHLAMLKEKYFNEKMTINEVQEELLQLMPEYEALISDSSVKHRELSAVKINLAALTHNKDYYVPSFEIFKKYADHYYVEPTKEIETLVEYIKSGITDTFVGTHTGELIVNTILFGLRANETPDQILLHIDNIEKNGFVKFTDRAKLTEIIANALNTTRLWTLNGHKQDELQHAKNLVDKDRLKQSNVTNINTNKNKKKPVQLKRKTKKRGKNRNVAHVAKLEDYRKK